MISSWSRKITFGAPNCIWDAELLRSLSTVDNKVDTGPRKVSSAEQRFLRFQSGIDEGQIKVKQVWLLFFKSDSHHITLAGRSLLCKPNWPLSSRIKGMHYCTWSKWFSEKILLNWLHFIFLIVRKYEIMLIKIFNKNLYKYDLQVVLSSYTPKLLDHYWKEGWFKDMIIGPVVVLSC